MKYEVTFAIGYPHGVWEEEVEEVEIDAYDHHDELAAILTCSKVELKAAKKLEKRLAAGGFDVAFTTVLYVDEVHEDYVDLPVDDDEGPEVI